MDENISFDKAASTNTVKFNQIGDFITGTLISVSAMTRPDKFGKLSNVYTVLTKEGKFLGTHKNPKTGKNELDKEDTVINPDEEWSIFAEKKMVFDQRLKSVKIGQFFKVELTEIKASTKGNDAKIKTVYPGLDKKGSPVFNTKWIETKKEQDKINSGDIAPEFNKAADDIDADEIPI